MDRRMDWSQMVSEPNQQPRVAVAPKGPTPRPATLKLTREDRQMLILIFAGEEQSASRSTSANAGGF